MILPLQLRTSIDDLYKWKSIQYLIDIVYRRLLLEVQLMNVKKNKIVLIEQLNTSRRNHNEY